MIDFSSSSFAAKVLLNVIKTSWTEHVIIREGIIRSSDCAFMNILNHFRIWLWQLVLQMRRRNSYSSIQIKGSDLQHREYCDFDEKSDYYDDDSWHVCILYSLSSNRLLTQWKYRWSAMESHLCTHTRTRNLYYNKWIEIARDTRHSPF